MDAFDDNRILLIDGDILAYRFAASNEDVLMFDDETDKDNKEEMKLAYKDGAIQALEDFVTYLRRNTGCKEVVMALSTQKTNFRYEVLPTYKHNRKNHASPMLRNFLNTYIMKNYKFIRKDWLEGDDVLGIMSTKYPGKYIIASGDKDMASIPGAFFHWKPSPKVKVEVEEITLDEANDFFYTQILTGDTADGYKGCPGVGPKKARKLLDDAYKFYENPEGNPRTDQLKTKEQVVWEFIVEAFEKVGLTEKDALQQARVARILRVEDYNLEEQKVRLWRPR